MQKCGKIMELDSTNYLEHESEMRLLKTRSHTSEQRGCEADKKRQDKLQRKEAYTCLLYTSPSPRD